MIYIIYINYTNCLGDSYVGQWDHDSRHGQGCYTYANGDVYTGDCHRLLEQIISTYNKTYCAGTILYNVKTGKGQKRYADRGYTYIGDFVDGLPHGKGQSALCT